MAAKTKKAETNGTTNRIEDVLAKLPPAPRGKDGRSPSPEAPDSSGKVKQDMVYRPEGVQVTYARFVIEGTTDLMTNAMSEEAKRGLMATALDGGKYNPPKPKTPEEAAYRAAHKIALSKTAGKAFEHFTEHLYGLPAISFKKTAIGALSSLNIKGKDKFNGSFFVHGPFNGLVPLLNGPPPLTREVIDAQGRRDVEELLAMAARPVAADVRTIAVKNGANTKAAVSIRPLFRDWYTEFYVKMYEDVVTPIRLSQFFQKAGAAIGIGSNRAGRSGDEFGLFRVVSVETMPKGWSPLAQRIDPKTWKPV